MIRIISIGKLREKYFLDACEEYLKRLTKYAKIEVIEAKSVESALKQAKGYLVILDEKGMQQDSEQFAYFIKDRDMTFIIGPAEGFTAKERENADYLLSLSKMTFPHQMAKLFLAEQIYRAFTILKNEKYHK
ncbi:MAG: 23S rRNA (pseudouridine(1915)-N(3))-methyltransferase RlmH [Nanoarchaeota archaeon]|mgnify:CR=1 FL=1